MTRFAFRDDRGRRASITRHQETRMADPIEPKLHTAMNALAQSLDETFNPRIPGLPAGKPAVGFVLLTFEFGKTEGGRVNYISNGERPDVIAAMREWLGRVEGRVADVPRTPQ